MAWFCFLLKGQKKEDFGIINSKRLLAFFSAIDLDGKERATRQGFEFLLTIIVRMSLYLCCHPSLPLSTQPPGSSLLPLLERQNSLH